MNVITEFDPWKNPLCTCPKKYSFNPYTGCMHKCAYCYATYVPRFWELREKKNLFKRLEKDLEKLPANALISMSNSSDPYPPVEKSRGITRKCLEILRNYDVKVLIITKSDIVTRDVDILREMRCAVAISVTGFSSTVFEPFAPKPEKRIEALKFLKDHDIPVILRLDPLMPWMKEEEWREVLEKCYFVDHVVTSTLKLRKDSFERIAKINPNLREFLKKLYFEKGEKICNSWYLSRELREKMLSVIAEKCKEMGISCAFCREGIPFKARSCDGSHLITQQFL
jgi:DNA repair photolyase